MTKAGVPQGPGGEEQKPDAATDVKKPTSPVRPPREEVTDDRPTAGDIAGAVKEGAPTKKG